MNKKILVFIIVLSLMVPVVSSSLLRTKGTVVYFQTLSKVRFLIKRTAPVIYTRENATPSRLFMYAVYRKNVYGIYERIKTGTPRMTFRLQVRWRYGIPWGVQWVGKYNVYCSGYGTYKVKVWFTENCYYDDLYIVRTFRVNPK
jgi:hypothetical protein